MSNLYQPYFLMPQSQYKNNKLSYALAMAVKNGKHNGEVEEAVEAYEKAKTNFYKFMNKQAIEHLKEK